MRKTKKAAAAITKASVWCAAQVPLGSVSYRDIIVCDMNDGKSNQVLDRLLSPLGDCLTPESARRILALKADPRLQAYVDGLATRHGEGRLSPAEQAEYGTYVSFNTFIAILKSKARQLLNNTPGA
jgi:hypothetical protein